MLALGKNFPDFPRSKGLQSGEDLNKISGNLGSFQSITAKAGGTKALATPVTAANVFIAVCATAADSILLPLGYAGLEIAIINNGAASCQIFGSGTDTIQAAATGTGVALANGAAAKYRCIGVTTAGVGIWNRFVSV